MSVQAKPYKLEFSPIVLKQIALDCDISQSELARAIAEALSCEISRPTINLCFNRGYVPTTIAGFKGAVEGFLSRHPRATAWLFERGLQLSGIWQPLGQDLRGKQLDGHVRRIKKGMHGGSAMVPGNPHIITVREVEMVNPETLKSYKLFRNPFIDDIQKDSDIYLSDEHRYIEAAMLDAAQHSGFLAVVGEVGSGKSVMRRKVIEQLKRDGQMLVVYPQTIDKTRLTAGSICDAIIFDISSEKPKVKLEDKSRQVQRLLLDRAKSGFRACLIIEEAHDLSVNTLKFLKRFHELEDGYRKLLGIVLIGQSELKETFDESTHVDMREVIRRVQIAEIKGLNGHLRDYLSVKFKRVGGKVEDIFAEDAFDALSRRLTSSARDGKSKVSHAYPLTVNNYAAKAMNLAFEMGETRITAEVIDAI